jgi:hypothetical protein
MRRLTQGNENVNEIGTGIGIEIERGIGGEMIQGVIIGGGAKNVPRKGIEIGIGRDANGARVGGRRAVMIAWRMSGMSGNGVISRGIEIEGIEIGEIEIGEIEIEEIGIGGTGRGRGIGHIGMLVRRRMG